MFLSSSFLISAHRLYVIMYYVWNLEDSCIIFVTFDLNVLLILKDKKNKQEHPKNGEPQGLFVTKRRKNVVNHERPFFFSKSQKLLIERAPRGSLFRTFNSYSHSISMAGYVTGVYTAF